MDQCIRIYFKIWEFKKESYEPCKKGQDWKWGLRFKPAYWQAPAKVADPSFPVTFSEVFSPSPNMNSCRERHQLVQRKTNPGKGKTSLQVGLSDATHNTITQVDRDSASTKQHGDQRENPRPEWKWICSIPHRVSFNASSKHIKKINLHRHVSIKIQEVKARQVTTNK